MNFAYLILAHKNPAQLQQLIKALDSDESIFIIHVDIKIAIRPFIKHFESYPPGKIFFCPNRKNIGWGCYSMVEATMSLIHFLFQMELKANYVHLLSGQDYPVKNSEEIVDFFKNSNGKNFLDFFSLPDQRWPENGMNRIQYHWGANEYKNIYYSDLEYKKRHAPKRHLPDGITPYGGSQWWSLHIDCARFLFEEYSTNNILFQFYRYSYIPDEMVFQTLILNSHFKDTVVNDNLRYIKWKSNAAHPEIITTDHLENILSDQKLFVRKVEPEHDSNVLTQLDIYRNNKANAKQMIENSINNSLIPATIEKKMCIITAVGKTSLHRKWIDKNSKFDLHLIVYDDSYDQYKNDTKFITQSKGYKFKLVYDYLTANKQVIDQYDYFYIPDDDIDIDIVNIHRLFWYMKEYKLAIAQPALTNSYCSYLHTIKHPNLIRYTNFVEVMQPCFSRNAIKKVLFTFNETISGWGIDFHWGKLIDYQRYNMAIIDDIISVHTRPIQSNHHDELEEYLLKYNLSRDIIESF